MFYMLLLHPPKLITLKGEPPQKHNKNSLKKFKINGYKYLQI